MGRSPSHHNHQYINDLPKRRARESNPQPHTGQLISNQPPHQFGYPPGNAAKSFLEKYLDKFFGAIRWSKNGRLAVVPKD